MAFDINADSYPDYDEWGWDDYWSVTDWQTFYDKLIQKYGADEGSRRWLDAWNRQSFGASPMNNRYSIAEWGIARGLYNSEKKDFIKPSEFLPPSTANQGQVINGQVVGGQPSVEDLEKAKKEGNKKLKGWLIGGGVLVVGLSIVYFVIRAKNQQQ
jgi:hypothetical protein